MTPTATALSALSDLSCAIVYSGQVLVQRKHLILPLTFCFLSLTTQKTKERKKKRKKSGGFKVVALKWLGFLFLLRKGCSVMFSSRCYLFLLQQFNWNHFLVVLPVVDAAMFCHFLSVRAILQNLFLFYLFRVYFILDSACLHPPPYPLFSICLAPPPYGAGTYVLPVLPPRVRTLECAACDVCDVGLVWKVRGCKSIDISAGNGSHLACYRQERQKNGRSLWRNRTRKTGIQGPKIKWLEIKKKKKTEKNGRSLKKG